MMADSTPDRVHGSALSTASFVALATNGHGEPAWWLNLQAYDSVFLDISAVMFSGSALLFFDRLYV